MRCFRTENKQNLKSLNGQFCTEFEVAMWYKTLGYVHTVPDSETERRRKCTG